MSLEKLQEKVGTQKHLLDFWNGLNETERDQLSEQILSMDFSACHAAFVSSAQPPLPIKELRPIPDERHVIKAHLSKDEIENYWNKGLNAIAKGQVAAVVLAGGQASRLGSDQPKGTLPLGLHISPQDSLLGLQAAKIAKLELLAREAYPDCNGKIQWLVMTSKSTDEPTRKHLEKVVPEAGLLLEQVTIFSQDNIPAFDMSGNFLLADKHTITTSPNGNGGLFSAISKYLPELDKRGVKYVHVYCVDNVLARVADPIFTGIAVEKGADVLTKTVERKPGELVGSVCLNDGVPRIVEYSELGAELESQKAPNGRLLFCAGSIANHLFTLDFLKSFCTPSFHLPYHRALKKISYVDANGVVVKPTAPNGIKLEQFVFDVFDLSKNFYIFEVKNEQEFAPLKNAESAGVDCLSTCRRSLANETRRWLKESGFVLPKGLVTYIKADETYAGEGLQADK
ncbi:hypothetical protein WR25_01133 [Diploscapter pachys]|uniref:UDP-N-acetylglucosamine diphosphorylase n=1 Tax=Diploscapter pachys TaxID=2018661 RepID=A0A2A2KUN4_9BILA|nr:hypothetical protein WR25_01133 [Diploscapter pachys]